MTQRGDAPDPTITVEHDGGLRFVARVRGHEIETDQPVYGGGEDSAAMPLEFLGTALGTCVALYVHRFLETRDLPTRGLRVEVASIGASQPRRIGRFDVRVTLPLEVPSRYLPMIERVAQSCPAHNTLRHPPDILVDVAQSAGCAPAE